MAVHSAWKTSSQTDLKPQGFSWTKGSRAGESCFNTLTLMHHQGQNRNEHLNSLHYPTNLAVPPTRNASFHLGHESCEIPFAKYSSLQKPSLSFFIRGRVGVCVYTWNTFLLLCSPQHIAMFLISFYGCLSYKIRLLGG